MDEEFSLRFMKAIEGFVAVCLLLPFVSVFICDKCDLLYRHYRLEAYCSSNFSCHNCKRYLLNRDGEYEYKYVMEMV